VNDPVFDSLTAMAGALRERRISAVDLLEAQLDRIRRLNPRLNAFTFVDPDGARDSAGKSHVRLRNGEPRGPLEGVPLSIKSSIAVGGFPWECGSRLRKGMTADTDAPLVRRLKDAGAVILGNTNTPEFLMAWETDNALYGSTKNPWDPGCTAGGSSGGEAAAIAACLSAGGFGSDGGGSIRQPAHFTGICGLKPTPGRIPATGHFPESAGPFAATGVVGPMARTVNDTRLLFEVTSGYDPGDPYGAPVPVGEPMGDLGGMRIGVFEDDGRTPVTPSVRDAVRKAADALERSGLRVEPFRPDNLDTIRQLWWNLFGRAGRYVLEPVLDGREMDVSPTLTQFMEYARESPALTLADFMRTLIDRDTLRRRLFQQMEAYPILLCPVSAVQAFRHGEREWEIAGQRVRYLDAWSYTAWFNLTGNPAIAVPVGLADGLPVGVQIVGRCWEEENLLAVAAVLEAAVGIMPRPNV
jgi:Asp-tRNA(Asn)/Glu-tRNA(Gln) amidotransferase A subunit family amidase